MAFFMLSFTSVSASPTVSENQVTVSNSSEFNNYNPTTSNDWWLLVSSNWVLAGGGK